MMVSRLRRFGRALPLVFCLSALVAQGADKISALPEGAKLVLSEDWSTGKIDPQKWYVPRKKWGEGNHGVVPENVRIAKDMVAGKKQHVLVCTAHGDQYAGDVVGLWGKKERVGGVIVSKQFFCSGRFEVVMKIGEAKSHEGGPKNPAHPIGTVPAIWTYGYRWVKVDDKPISDFVADSPLFNPHMPAYGIGANEYWSELDFPEFGKGGDFKQAMYNTFCQNRHHPKLFDMRSAADGEYHTYTSDWRTKLVPLPEIRDEQVREHLGYFWIKEKAVPFESYLGNPLRRLGPNKYALCTGDTATHWLDGQPVAENRLFVPAMGAQLTMGVWLPNWAGPAPWQTAEIKFASAKVWQFDDPGDVRGVIVDDINNNFDVRGNEIR